MNKLNTQQLKRFFRLLLSFICFAGVFFFSNVFLFSIVELPASIQFMQPFISIVAGLVIAKFIWAMTAFVHPTVASYSFIGAISLGSIGFIGGFIWPLIFSPENNLGPLLGIFITGPLGFALGLIGGIVVGLNKKIP
jgi:hypothetical protein